MNKEKVKMEKTEEEWKQELSPEQYEVLRKKGTERPFTGAYWDNKSSGGYRCAGCNSLIFDAETKFDSGTGWPSFYQPAEDDKVETHKDFSMLIPRTEVTCSNCGGHLGHVFNDGPEPTGKRYCINSCALKFEAKDNPA